MEIEAVRDGEVEVEVDDALYSCKTMRLNAEGG